MTDREKKLYALFLEVRTCFNRLKSLAEGLHAELGVNPSMRAVMEALSMADRQTVPELAKRRGVSRQHIQTVINGLLDEGYVEAHDNPAHRRSPIYALTAKGSSVFSQIRELEAAPLSRLAASIPDRSVEHADSALREINKALEREIESNRP